VSALVAAPEPVAAALRAPGPVLETALDVLNDTHVLVTWDPPSVFEAAYGGDGGAPVESYLVEHSPDELFDGPAKRATVAAGTAQAIVHVAANSTVYVRVSAKNSVGYGPSSGDDLSTELTLRPVSRVRAVTATPASATSVVVGWDAPLRIGGAPILDYVVQYEVGSHDFYASNGTDAAHAGSVVVPATRAVQAAVVASDRVVEEQHVVASVRVVNEVQTVQTSAPNTDEVQLVVTTADVVRPMVQTFTLTTQDMNEVQSVQTTGSVVDEIQLIRTDLPPIDEVQLVSISATREAEVQQVAITLKGGDATTAPGRDAMIATHAAGSGYELTFDTTACVFCTVKSSAATVLVDDVTEVAGAAALQAALEGLTNVGAGEVTVVGSVV
jgi:hypothetical protein